jgi:molybdopterin-guanine dinucleotide biosynthesis protein A
MRLGAVLAGGESRRFGSDKALALHRGTALIDHARASLAPHVDAVVVVGGERAGVEAVPDRPAPGLGPLGGVCGALAYARLHGFEAVLTVPCDTPDLPAEALTSLIATGAPAYLAALPVAGLWLARDVSSLGSHLAGGGRRSVRGWCEACGAVPVAVAAEFANVNRPEDLPRN